MLSSVRTASATDAGSEAQGGSPSAEEPAIAPIEERDETAEPKEDEAREEEPREAEPPEPERVESPAAEPRRPVPARPAEAVPPTTEYPPGRADFMRRLRATAEDLERGKASEPTQVHTHGDVTVLTNVAIAPTAPEKVHLPPEPQLAATLGEAVTEAAEPADVLAGQTAPAEAPVSARPKDDSAPWHWLWALAGVATVLLVPITRLLTRATRSS